MSLPRQWPSGFLLLVVLATACSGPAIEDVVTQFADGDYDEALETLDDCRADDPGNSQLYDLEEAMILLAAGDPDGCVQVLRSARDQLDSLAGDSLREQVNSLLLDDRQRDWEGSDYEHVLVRALLAVAELMARGSGAGSDAEAYALQVLERQQEIIRNYQAEGETNPKAEYRLVAFGSYLRAVLNEEQPLNRDVARRSFRKALELKPGLGPAMEGLERTTTGRHSRKGHGVVHVFAMLGRGPRRVEREEVASTSAINLAKLLWAAIRGNAALPEVRAVPIPGLDFLPGNPASMLVEVDGRAEGSTRTVTDIEQVARTEFDVMQEQVVVRAILRRALKVAVVEGSKEGIRNNVESVEGRFVAELGASIAGLIWTSTEGADLRCWRLLPATIQVCRVELPVGEHELVLRPRSESGQLGAEQRIRVDVRDGRNTYVLAMTPTVDGGPTPLTSLAPFPFPALETEQSSGG